MRSALRVFCSAWLKHPSGPDAYAAFGVAAIAGMTGMFSKQATDKLREVFETLFGVKDDRPDKLTGDRP